jgi:hypothetical protein
MGYESLAAKPDEYKAQKQQQAVEGKADCQASADQDCNSKAGRFGQGPCVSQCPESEKQKGTDQGGSTVKAAVCGVRQPKSLPQFSAHDRYEKGLAKSGCSHSQKRIKCESGIV